MKEQLQIIPTELLSAYLEHVPRDLPAAFNALEDAEISTENFSFYTSVSSVFSSKIEGEEIEFSDGFTELHTQSYQEILKGNGFGVMENKTAIEIVSAIRK